jgi:hypothetical protein
MHQAQGSLAWAGVRDCHQNRGRLLVASGDSLLPFGENERAQAFGFFHG